MTDTPDLQIELAEMAALGLGGRIVARHLNDRGITNTGRVWTRASADHALRMLRRTLPAEPELPPVATAGAPKWNMPVPVYRDGGRLDAPAGPVEEWQEWDTGAGKLKRKSTRDFDDQMNESLRPPEPGEEVIDAATALSMSLHAASLVAQTEVRRHLETSAERAAAKLFGAAHVSLSQSWQSERVSPKQHARKALIQLQLLTGRLLAAIPTEQWPGLVRNDPR